MREWREASDELRGKKASIVPFSIVCAIYYPRTNTERLTSIKDTIFFSRKVHFSSVNSSIIFIYGSTVKSINQIRALSSKNNLTL